jgi:hypothetical protein
MFSTRSSDSNRISLRLSTLSPRASSRQIGGMPIGPPVWQMPKSARRHVVSFVGSRIPTPDAFLKTLIVRPQVTNSSLVPIVHLSEGRQPWAPVKLNPRCQLSSGVPNSDKIVSIPVLTPVFLPVITGIPLPSETQLIGPALLLYIYLLRFPRTYITPTDPVYSVSSLPPKSDTLLHVLFCLTILVFSFSRVGSKNPLLVITNAP